MSVKFPDFENKILTIWNIAKVSYVPVVYRPNIHGMLSETQENPHICLKSVFFFCFFFFFLVSECNIVPNFPEKIQKIWNSQTNFLEKTAEPGRKITDREPSFGTASVANELTLRAARTF